jgi:hypothetical protein
MTPGFQERLLVTRKKKACLHRKLKNLKKIYKKKLSCMDCQSPYPTSQHLPFW